MRELLLFFLSIVICFGDKTPPPTVEKEVAPDEVKPRYKIAIFAPYVANSQVLFNKRVGEELANAGHDVTIYIIHMLEHAHPPIAIDDKIRVVNVNASTGLNGTELLEKQSKVAFKDLKLWDKEAREGMKMFASLSQSCALLIRNNSFLSDIENSNFDIAFTHIYNFCPIGIIHKTKIPTWIWLSSGALVDNIAALIGVPLPPSYCAPMMMDAGDRLSFIERIKSFIGHGLFKVLWKRMVPDTETNFFREVFGHDFPDVTDLARKAPLVMVNSDELYDFARPTLHKVINIGGIGIKSKDVKPLKEEYASRIAKAKGVIVMSFGSVAPMYLMPDHWKDAYFHTFKQFPDVQFFLRYEKPDEIADQLPKNVFASKWLPQSDLLQHPKTLGLISHGGYNSIQDVIHAGVPIVATGLFGDQPKNAHLVEKLGMGVNLHKTKVNRANVEAAVRKLVEDNSLKASAQKLRAMVATKPVSAETLLVKYTEFLAQHKNLDHMIPEGADMNIFVYHSIDVILFLSVIILTVIILKVLCIRFVFRKICGRFFSQKKTSENKKKQ